jgi:hypothetical protein
MVAAALLSLATLCLIPAAPAWAMDGVMMKGGQMMMMQDGKPTAPMTSDIAMPNGTKVTTGGVVLMRNGEERHLHEGDMVLMNGHVMRGGRAQSMKPE